MRGGSLRIGIGDAVRHDFEPRLELVGAAKPDLNPLRGDSRWFALEGEPEHVFERRESVPAFGQ
jgi:hypothetical protein